MTCMDDSLLRPSEWSLWGITQIELSGEPIPYIEHSQINTFSSAFNISSIMLT